jgi:GDPmannose 4,6-dehydratase
MKKRALITGITGQDGSFLAELLLSKGYEVFGSIRRHSIDEVINSRIGHIIKDVNLEYADLTDLDSMQKIVDKSKPDEVYNLASQSDVKVSYENPIYTANTIAIGTLNLLEAIRHHSTNSNVYQACTSEMFGGSIDEDGYQRETTPFKPANPYACAKAFSFNVGVNYRVAYNMYISNGILFNHESSRRGENFVTTKVVKAAVKIHKGLQADLKLGTLDSYRDWGHAKDYVKSMHLILQQDKADDYVCATGKVHSIKDLCEYVFRRLGMDYRDYVKLDPNFVRPQETKHFKGDHSKLTRDTGWIPEFSFEDTMDEMIDFYLNKI